MPPPILKKAKGQTASGPRPTARFISPHSSEDDVAPESSSDPNGSSHVTVRPPTPEAKPSISKSSAIISDGIAGPRKKGHVATTAGHKRRPGIVRRNTPQTVTDAGVRGIQGASETVPARNDALRRSRQESSEDSNGPIRRQSRSKLQENFSSSTENKVEKTASKKPRSTKSKLSKQSSTSTSTSDLGPTNKRDPNGKQRLPHADAGPSRERRAQGSTEVGVSAKADLDDEELQELKLQEALLAQANARLGTAKYKDQSQAEISLDTGLRSEDIELNKSKSSQKRPVGEIQDVNKISVSPLQPIARSGLVMTDEDSGVLEAGKGKERSGESNFFAKRPIQPVSAASSLLADPSIPSSASLGRSKSQLTLLLEQDRAKESDDKSTNKQKASK